ncbi:MAG TPA: hypothetical protein VGS12_02530 [Caulobacteraceae bacterium]|nr:hypothetical protein [Caulobacteraceae bacterium]
MRAIDRQLIALETAPAEDVLALYPRARAAAAWLPLLFAQVPVERPDAVISLTSWANLVLSLHASWIIQLNCIDGAGDPIDLVEAAAIEWRLANAAGEIVLDLSLGQGITVIDAGAGVAIILVTPSLQQSAQLTAGLYDYEGRVTLIDGTVTDAALGTLNARASLF